MLLVLTLLSSIFPQRRGLPTHWLEDPSGQWTLSDVRAQPESAWHNRGEQAFNQGYSRSTFWLRIDLPQWDEGARYLGIGNPLLEHLSVHRLRQGSNMPTLLRLGMARPFAERPLPFVSFVVPLSSADSGATLWLQVNSRTSVQVPLDWWDETAWARHQQQVSLFHGSYLGVTAAMLAFNLLLYLAIRERAYLWYLGWMVCIAAFVFTLNGSSFQWLWPHAPAWNLTVLPTSLSLAIACSAGFFVHFLREGGRAQPGEALFWLLGLGNLALAAAAPALPYRVAIVGAIAMAMATMLVAIVSAAQRALRGNFGAQYFLIAFSFVIAAGVVLALNKLGLIARTFITEHATEVGSAVEMVVLSLAIIARLNHQRRQREIAQAALLDAQQRLTTELEVRVAERTEALQEANAKLTELSQTDALTGIFNRRYLDAHLERELRRLARDGNSMAVMLIDVDHFKRFNDTHGHPAGDACLQAVAAALSANVRRPSDTVARYGGEEFCVLAPDTTEAGAVALAETLRAAVADLRVVVDGVDVAVTTSIGLCWRTPEHPWYASALLKKADEALYGAKAGGRNRVHTV
ncbi:MAG: diguanylate cyclase [Hydrogenophaga sp.]|nr:diguanylate cyclase [Hydrogenophaga sp.]